MDLSFPSIKRGLKGCVKKGLSRNISTTHWFYGGRERTYTPLGPLFLEGKRCSHGNHFSVKRM